MTEGRKDKMKREIKRLSTIILGILLMAAGSALFVVPSGFITGGVTGLALVLARIVPLSVSALISILSVVFLLFGLITLGKEFRSEEHTSELQSR